MKDPYDMQDMNSHELNINERTEDFSDNFSLNMPINDEQIIDQAIINNFGEKNYNKENDENFYEEVSQKDIFLNKAIHIKKDLIPLDNLSNKITNPITSTNQKMQIFNLEDNSCKNSIRFESFRLIDKKQGRKIKDFHLNQRKTAHNKYSKDNMMRKIKTNSLDYITKLLNKSLKDKTKKFYKINKKVAENLKIDFNIKLMKQPLHDLFLNEKISNKYSKKNNNNNVLLIKKIFDENIELETIRILNMKYIDIIREITEKYLDDFLDIIKKKEKKNDIINNDENEYLKLLEKMLLGYEDYFKNKKGRNTEKIK